MVDIRPIKTAVKLTLHEMSCIRGYCRCCFSANNLNMLCDPELYVYKLLCSFQGSKFDDSSMAVCLQCHEFLKEVYQFGIECNGFVGIHFKDSGNKSHEVELVFENIKTEIIDEKVPENSQNESKSAINTEDNLLVEFERSECPLISSNDKPFKCNECSYKTTTMAGLKRHTTSKHFSKTSPNKLLKCTECSYQSLTRSELKEHISHKHDVVKPFTCDQCSYSASKKIYLVVHKRIHLTGNDNPFKCSECAYKTTTMSSLKRHTTVKHSDEKPFGCDQCDYRGKFKSDLNRHMANHFGDSCKPLKCAECSFRSFTPYRLKEHILHKHAYVKTFSCDQCNYCATTNKYLIVHKRIHLTGSDNPFKCSECSFKTTTMSNLKRHVTVKHSGEKLFGCDHCDFRGTFKFELVRHMTNHFGDSYKPFKCAECSYRSFTRSELKDHILHKHTGVKLFSCDQCDYSASKKVYLSVHKRIHLTGSDNPFKCNECAYKTTNMSNLKRHTMVNHSGEKRFSCDHCDYRGNFKFELVKHMANHFGDSNKPFKCTECSYRSFTRHALKEHISHKHSGVKPFSCDQCNYRASTKKYLNVHKRIHFTGIDNPFKCNECSFKTTNMSNLKRHIMIKHSDEKPFGCDQCNFRAKSKRQKITHEKSHLKNKLREIDGIDTISSGQTSIQ